MAARNSVLFCLVCKKKKLCVCVLESNHKTERNSNTEPCELSLKGMAVLGRRPSDLDLMSKPGYIVTVLKDICLSQRGPRQINIPKLIVQIIVK